MLILGFTGTQHGLTDHQKQAFARFLHNIGPGEFHHGDCIGADREAHDIVRGVLKHCRIVVHPPEDPKKRAWCKGDITLPPKPYLERNHDIVDACDLLVAGPQTSQEKLRSGTWATIRYARKQGRRVSLLIPDPQHYTT